MASPTPQEKRRAVFCGILLAAACLAWVSYIPERGDRAFRAMPANCVAVTENLDLTEKWRERLANPALLGTMRACGVEEPEEIANDADVELTLRLLCGRRTVLGYVPELGQSRKPAFVGASYVGARLTPMRLIMLFRHVPGLGPLKRTEAGTLYLEFEDHNDFEYVDGRKKYGMLPEVLSLDLREGVLLAAWSLDRDAVRTLSWRLSHDAPLAPVFDGDEPWRAPLREPMRAWVDRDMAVEFADGPVLASNPRIAVPQWDSVKFEARISARFEGVDAALPRLAGKCPALDTLPDDPPIAIAVMPGAMAAEAIEVGANHPNGTIDANGGDACLALTGRDFGCKVYGLALPGLQLTMPWSMPQSSIRDSCAFVISDLLNHAIGAGAQIRGTQDGGQTLLLDPKNFSIIKTSDSDCIALGMHLVDDMVWLTATTSAAAADKMRASPVTGKAPWRKGWRKAYGNKDCSFYFWADLGSLSSEMATMLSVYRLAATFISELADEEMHEAIESANMALRDFAVARQLECLAESGDDGMTAITIRFGE